MLRAFFTRIFRTALVCPLFFLAPAASERQDPEKASIILLPPPAKVKIEFQRDIEPILSVHCQSCHGPTKQSGGLRLDSRAAALAGGYSGIVIKPGNSGDSRLIHLVAGLDKELTMPVKGDRLSENQISLLRAWIDQGVDWPDPLQPSHERRAVLEIPAPASSPADNRTVGSHTAHWAFVPPQRPKIPRVRNQAWVRNPIDSFVLARLETENIEPSPEADRITLLRRLSLDLTGLPPTLDEVQQFLSDNRSDAYGRLVDRLLASSHYGEKWARHWLDLARYGDSDGYETDAPRPYAWRYRDWVINALNANMPFDQFTLEQIAGDLLPGASTEQKVATGFHRNTLTNREGGMDLEQIRTEQMIDRTDTFGTVWLGLTLGCARCHDHKYDPVSQKEYYQLYAFFNTARELNIEAPLPGEMGPYLHGKPEYDKKRHELLAEYKVPELQPEWEEKVRDAATNPDAPDPWKLAWDHAGFELDGGQDILRLEPSRRTEKQRNQLTDHFITRYGLVVGKEGYERVKFKELQEKLEKLSEQYPPLTEAQAIAQNATPPRTHIFIRGDYQQPGVEVEPGTPAFLHPLPADSNATRLSLARWVVSESNPLTARVTVNRTWQELFGRGLVETSENFGNRGEPPSHPELLDWLATEFMTSNWDVKNLQKLIVQSATYRQSSKARKELQSRDPQNRLMARQSRFRLSAELIRDVTLAVSGLLNPTIGGRSVQPPLPASIAELAFRNQWKESRGADRYRRGLYVFFKRTLPYPQLVTFDAPNSFGACSRRERSVTPLQALTLMNDPEFFEAAQALAARILRDGRGDPSERIDFAFRLCLARSPAADEKDRLLRYYKEQVDFSKRNPDLLPKLFPPTLEGIDPVEVAAWMGVSRLLLNLDEFITRE